MKIISPAFEDQQTIPKIYTCDDENISPPLMFIDKPEGTMSLALIVEDPDVPKNIRADGLWIHWLVWDMPANIHEIPEGAAAPGVVGQNTRGIAAYGGPCPPDREHRYFFKLYALDANLTDARIAGKDDLEKAMEGHILAAAELVGRYNRQ